jgi:hypothetical protein
MDGGLGAAFVLVLRIARASSLLVLVKPGALC